MWPPTVIRILLAIPTIYEWYISKIDVKFSFLLTVEAKRDIYVVPLVTCFINLLHFCSPHKHTDWIIPMQNGNTCQMN